LDSLAGLSLLPELDDEPSVFEPDPDPESLLVLAPASDLESDPDPDPELDPEPDPDPDPEPFEDDFSEELDRLSAARVSVL
jgi:pilus assembly protein FimV